MWKHVSFWKSKATSENVQSIKIVSLTEIKLRSEGRVNTRCMEREEKKDNLNSLATHSTRSGHDMLSLSLFSFQKRYKQFGFKANYYIKNTGT